MKVLNILFVLLSFFIVSCGDSEKKYDYSNTGRTDGLAVYPSILKLTTDVPSGYFALSYATEDITFIGADNSSLTENFSLDKSFTADGAGYCASKIATSGECRIFVTYEPKSTGNHEGKLILKFLYSEDLGGEQAKDHVLNVTGVNVAPIPPVPDNNTGAE